MSIFDLCVPRDDVLKSGISEGEFAADLDAVLSGRASQDYSIPAQFFANTYPTTGIRELLADVCRRLTGQGDSLSSVFRLDTAFGGGKTHGLIALVHAARGMQGVSNAREFLNQELIPKKTVRIAAFDGESADPSNGRRLKDGAKAFTPWGDIAFQLGDMQGFELVRRSDEDRIAPGKETIIELIGTEPALIVLDELGEYLRRVKHMAGRDQLTAFLKALCAAVEGSPNAALVYTLAVRADGKGVDAFAEENEFLARAMQELESVSGRKATNLNPTKDDETPLVLRRRLFKSIDDAAAGSFIDEYLALWAKHKDVISEEGRQTRREEFAQCYPFHPDVLNTLTGKTATLAGFQRVRGMLRILGKTVQALWADRPEGASAIHLHHIDLGREDIRREFTTRLGQTAYDSAILNDIAGSSDKRGLAREIDDKHYHGLAPYASYAARTIFLHTLAYNNELRGLAADHLRFAMLCPSLDATFIDSARTKFVAESAYLDDRPAAPLCFNAEANLTQLISREETRIDAGEIRSELNDRIRQIFNGSSLDLIAFPSAPYDVSRRSSGRETSAGADRP